MRSRPTLSPSALLAILQRAFEARRSNECTKCKVPLPYAVPRPDDVSANWRIGTPADCPHKCGVLLTELALDLASRYDMSDYVPDEPEARPTRNSAAS